MYDPRDKSGNINELNTSLAPGSSPQEAMDISASHQDLKGERISSVPEVPTQLVPSIRTTSEKFTQLSPEEKKTLLTKSLADPESADRAVDALVNSCAAQLAKQRSLFAWVNAAESFIKPFLTALLPGGGMSAVVGVVGSMGSSMVFSLLSLRKTKISGQLDNLIVPKAMAISTSQIYDISYHDRNEPAVVDAISQNISNQSAVSEFISLRYQIMETWGAATGALLSMSCGGWHNVAAAVLVASGAWLSHRIEKKKKELNEIAEREKGSPSTKMYTPAKSFVEAKTADQLCVMGQEKFPERYLEREGKALTKVFNDFLTGLSKLAFQNWLINAATCSAAGGYLLLQLTQGAISVESVVQFSAAVVGFQSALGTLIETSGRRDRAAVGANRALDLAGHWRRVSGSPEPATPERVNYIREELREKRFSLYLNNIKVDKSGSEGVKTILDINTPVEIKAGELVGIVGETGAGKTTFMRVLLGIEKPTQGDVEIRIGEGADARVVRMSEMPLRALHGEIGYAPQDGFEGKELIVEEFLSLGKTSDDQNPLTIEEAIKKVGAEFLLEHLKKRIGQEWSPSGGQRVLMRVVQSVLGGRPMHILDEPLTGLDTTHREKIVNMMEAEAGTKTQIYITHDFLGFRSADKLIVIEKDKPLVSGMPDQLLKESGHYRDLWEINERHRHKLPRQSEVPCKSSPAGSEPRRYGAAVPSNDGDSPELFTGSMI